jgi:hypothetical protein
MSFARSRRRGAGRSCRRSPVTSPQRARSSRRKRTRTSWVSDAWTRRDKLIGTLIVPGGLLLPFTLLMFVGSSSGQLCSGVVGGPMTCTGGGGGPRVLPIVLLAALLAAPLAVALYLALRLRRR